MSRARATLPNPQQTDILILVIGLTGAGKSSFINEVLRAGSKEEAPLEVGSSLSPCTTDYEFVIVEQETDKYPSIWGSRIVLIDTPGFDNPSCADLVTLHSLSTLLKGLYPRSKVPIQGIVYIHDLNVDRQGVSTARNIEYFKRLQDSGNSILGKTVLATSKWELVKGLDYGKRESELRETHWKDLINPKSGQTGAVVKRLGEPGVEGAALDVIQTILQRLDGNFSEDMRAPCPHLEPGDIVILVMGQTGAGRSTFINALLRGGGVRGMKVGHSQDPCTTEVHCAMLDLTLSSKCRTNYRLFLVDTPGFNDSDGKRTDSDILEAILRWLQEWLKPALSCKVGVIYLEDISVEPLPAVAKVDSVALRKNLNSEILKQLSFVTTKWKYSKDPEGRHRGFEEQIAALVTAGSKVYPFKNDEDAWSVLRSSLPNIEASGAVDIGKILAAVRATTQKRPRRREASILTRLFGLFERFTV